MHDALSLLSQIDTADAEWLLAAGRENEVRREDVVVAEGTRPDRLWIVLEGLLDVRTRTAGDRPLNLLGPGELIGELAFLEDREASATVRVVEDGVVLSVPHADLNRRMEADPPFAARLYRALGRIAAARLRKRDTSGGPVPTPGDSDAAGEPGGDAWTVLSSAIAGFRELMQRVDDTGRKHDGVLPDELVEEARAGFDGFCLMLHETLGDHSPLPVTTREQLGQRVQRELHSFILLTRVCERILIKPRGYAGDFMTIEWMYGDDPGGSGVVGPLIDRLFLDRPAAQAVRNRRGLLSEEIAASLNDPKSAGRITTLACGPAAELFDVFASPEVKEKLHATLIDIDLQALALVSDRRDKLGLRKQMDLLQANLVYLATGRQSLELPPQDLAYSIGLIDYFQDRFVIALLDWIHDRLRPGGRAILGNFQVDNPDKALMDHVFDWKLIHRTDEDMHRLFTASRFGAACTQIRYEAAGVNLFAIGTKA